MVQYSALNDFLSQRVANDVAINSQDKPRPKTGLYGTQTNPSYYAPPVGSSAGGSSSIQELLNGIKIPDSPAPEKEDPKVGNGVSTFMEHAAQGDILGGLGAIAKESIHDLTTAPVIKQVLDALSTLNYAGANIADEMATSAEEGSGPLSYIADVGQGLAEGVGGGFLGLDEYKTTYSDAIKHIQSNMGIDTEDPTASMVAGIAGFAGDVLLDPTTYLSLGLAKAASKGGKAAQTFTRESAEASKAGKSLEDVAPYLQGRRTKEYEDFLKNNRTAKLRPVNRSKEEERVAELFKGKKYELPRNRREAFLGGARQGKTEFRSNLLEEREAKALKKQLRKSSPDEKIDYLRTNIDGLKPVIAIKIAQDAAKEKALAQGAKLTTKKEVDAATEAVIEDAKGTLNEVVPDVPVPVGDIGKNFPEIVDKVAAENTKAKAALLENPKMNTLRLAQTKKMSEAASVYETLSKVRTGEKTLPYSKNTIAKVNSINNRNKAVENAVEAKPKKSINWNKLADDLGTRGGVSNSRMASAIRKFQSGERTPPTGESLQRFMSMIPSDALKAATYTKTPKTLRAVTDDDYLEAGVAEKDILAAKVGELSEEGGDNLVGDVRRISRDIAKLRNGIESPLWHVVADLDDIATSRYSNLSPQKAVARYITDESKSPEFKAYAHDAAKFATEGGRVPTQIGSEGAGYRGSMQSIENSPLFTKGDIAVVKQLATPMESEAFLKAQRLQAKEYIDALPEEFREATEEAADMVYYAAVGNQKLTGGMIRSPRKKAFINELYEGAKYPGKWNTHANINYLSNTMRVVKQMYKDVLEPVTGKKSTKYRADLMDQTFLAITRNVDARLVDNGIDMHLSNMSPDSPIDALKKAEKVMTVRLAPSDVFSYMTPSARKKALFSQADVYPTSVLDVAEYLVRNATKLTPNGTLDMEMLKADAHAAYLGRYGTKGGKREIKSNLDDVTKLRHASNTLHMMGHDDLAKNINKKVRYTAASGKTGFRPKTFNEYMTEIRHALGTDDVDGLSVFNNGFEEYNKKYVNPVVMSFFKGYGNGTSPINVMIYKNLENTAVRGRDLLDKAEQASKDKYDEIMASIKAGSTGGLITASATAVKSPSNSEDITLLSHGLDDQVTEDMGKIVDRTIAQDQVKAAKKHSNSENKDIQYSDITEQSKVFKTQAELDGLHSVKDPLDAIHRDMVRSNLTDGAKQERAEASVENLYDINYRAVTSASLKGFFGSKFNPTFGKSITWEKINQSAHAHTHIQAAFHTALGTLWKGATTNQVRDSFKRIQNAFLNSEHANPMNVLSKKDWQFYRLIDHMFDPGTNNFFSRNSVGIRHFQKNLNGEEAFGRSNPYSEAFDDPDMSGKEMAQAWMNWEVENPLDFLSKMSHVMSKTSEEIAMGSSFSYHFGVKGPMNGYVKINDTSGRSRFFHLIDKELYYPQEVANEIKYIDAAMNDSRKVMSNFIRNAFDPIISTLKLTQTTMKPGHHVMSVIGDGWRNSLAGMGTSTKEYGDMVRIMKAVRPLEKGKTDIDSYAEIKQTASSVSVGQKINEKMPTVTIMINRKKKKISATDLMRLMEQRGVALPDHVGGAAEDLLTDVGVNTTRKTGAYGVIDKSSKFVDKFANNKWFRLNKISSQRDTIMRGALFINRMQSKNFKTLEEAADYGSSVVKKWAPVATDLANWEQRYARRGIFYYTWVRGMTPRIIEMAFTKPGVSMIPSKLMYNIAVSQGLDPMSFGNPFPEGANLPTWYSERVLGPLWESNGDLMGISPTAPTIDIFNTLSSDVTIANLNPFNKSGDEPAWQKYGKTLLGMSTPWLQAPIELVSGTKLESGAPVQDTGEYLQDMIGPVRFASRFTGKDFLPGLPNRTTSLYREGMDPETAKHVRLSELFNYLTGAGLTNYTSDSAETAHYFQELEKSRKKNRLEQRYGIEDNG